MSILEIRDLDVRHGLLQAVRGVSLSLEAGETLAIFAPLAHRLGIHAIKWELEDLAFATLHPRKYTEVKGLVNQQRAGVKLEKFADSNGPIAGI